MLSGTEVLLRDWLIRLLQAGAQVYLIKQPLSVYVMTKKVVGGEVAQ